MLFPLIQERALAWSIAWATPAEIDELNILHATMLAMQRAVSQLSVVPEYALIDGNRCPPGLPCPAEPIVKGDLKEPAISAASILAKVYRDREMAELICATPIMALPNTKATHRAAYGAVEAFGTLARTPS